MVSEGPSLLEYPIFRLTVSMAVGIFLCYCLRMWMMAHGGDLPILWLLMGTLLGLFLGLLVLWRRVSYGGRAWFGLVTAFFFSCLGGFRLEQECSRIDFSWSEEEEVYLGRLVTSPVLRGKTWQAEVRVESCFSLAQTGGDSLQGTFSGEAWKSVSVNRNILLYAMPDSTQKLPSCGSRIVFSGRVSRPMSDEELTGFDYGEYLYRKGISGTAMAFGGHWKRLAVDGESDLKERALKCRDWIVEMYRSWNLDSEELAVVAALTVGDKSGLTNELKARYSAAGVSHVLALSGMHVGIFSCILLMVLCPLKRLPHGESFRSLLVVLALWNFAFLSGLSPSVVRAVTMCTLYFGASVVLEERFSSRYVLVLTAFLMLLYQPLYLFDLSFQLSFLAVASILYFCPLIQGLVAPRLRLFQWLWNGISVSLSAQLGTLPLILYYFGTFPVYFLLANLMVSVLAVCVLGGTLVVLLFSQVPLIGSWVIAFLTYSVRILNASIAWVQQLDGSQLTSLSVSAFQSVCGFLFLFSLYQFWTRRRPVFCLVLLFSLNLTLGAWVYHGLFPQSPALYFSRSALYLKQGDEIVPLASPNGLYEIDTLRLAVLNDTTWIRRQSVPRIPLHYAYICRGFHGNLSDLQRVFHIRRVILDTSLSNRNRIYLQQQCEKYHIAYTNLASKEELPYYRIPLCRNGMNTPK